jgi:tRNA A-37 threonylcarbamoyl transferase component Bud32
MPERYLGRQLGRFRVDTLIGTGGFAWVYEGYDPTLDIKVAIKVLKPQYAGENVIEGRFRHEASIAAKLRHPNIIRVIAVDREGDAVYFVMDYLPDGLDKRLMAQGTLSEPQLLRLGIDVAAALQFAHAEGVIHRDIKTENILFDSHGNAIVADFGIARATTGYVDRTGTGMVVGTPQYFSPEQARGHALDGRSDIYSLGITLYQAATGDVPFDGEDWYEVARRHIEDPPRPPREINPTLSEEMQYIILKALAKKPAERYADAEAMRQEMVRLLGGKSTPLALLAAAIGGGKRVLIGTTEETPKWRRLRWTAAVVAVIAVLGAMAFIWRPTRERPVPAAAAEPVLPAVTVSADSAGAAADSAIEASGYVRRMEVSAPDGARILLDDVAVGSAPWSTDSIEPGAHRVAAQVATLAGCSSAKDDTSITVAAHGLTSITLSPRACGTLVLDTLPAGAQYTVTRRGGGIKVQRSGKPPAKLVLPVGHYTLEVSGARFCTRYSDQITIAAGATLRKRVLMLCK